MSASDVLWVYILFIVYKQPIKSRKIANFYSRTILGKKKKMKEKNESGKEGREKNRQGSLKLVSRLIVELVKQ